MAVTVLSMDPGTKNFAASVFKASASGDTLKMKVAGTRMVANSIREPKDLAREIRGFRAEIYALEHAYGPFDLVVAERFQSRGLRGTTIESINMMLGGLSMMYPQLQVYTASTWKNSFNRLHSHTPKFLDQVVYDEWKAMHAGMPKAERTTVHELDCTLMGVYHTCKHFGLEPFANLSSEGRVMAFLNHLYKCPRL